MMNVQKEARKDAAEYARAKMYYGDGAGNRRKLIQATVDGKTRRDPKYGHAFRLELARQDMAEHALKARHERQRHDRNETLARNAKGLVTGNYAAMNTSVFALIVGGYWAHKTGYDVVVYDKAKLKVNELRLRYKNRKSGKDGVYTVTNIK